MVDHASIRYSFRQFGADGFWPLLSKPGQAILLVTMKHQSRARQTISHATPVCLLLLKLSSQDAVDLQPRESVA